MGLHLPRSATRIKLSLALPRYARRRAPAHRLCIGTCMHWHAHAHVMCLRVMGLHLSRSAMRIRLSPSLLGASVLATRFV